MNPNYLLQDELQYKVHIHAIISQTDAQLLFELFRFVTPQDIPINQQNLTQVFPHSGLMPFDSLCSIC